MTARHSDMSGNCPKDTPQASCIPGPKWTPNGKPFQYSDLTSTDSVIADPLFFLHHAVSSENRFIHCFSDKITDGRQNVVRMAVQASQKLLVLSRWLYFDIYEF